MRYESWRPTDPHVARAVEHIWLCESHAAAGQERRFPTGRAQLVFGLDPVRPTATVQGPLTRPVVIEASAKRLAVGVALRPGGLHALTGEAAADLADCHTEAGQVLGGAWVHAVERLQDAVAAGRTADVLEQMLAVRLRTVGRPTSAVTRIASDLLGQGRPVRQSAQGAGVAGSRLTDVFRVEVGVTPKRFSRLLRFEQAVRAVRSVDAPELTTVAAELGYADQAHMTREFSEFAGVSPGVLHRDGSSAPNHLAV